jgi:hypothetical protein
MILRQRSVRVRVVMMTAAVTAAALLLVAPQLGPSTWAQTPNSGPAVAGIADSPNQPANPASSGIADTPNQPPSSTASGIADAPANQSAADVASGNAALASGGPGAPTTSVTVPDDQSQVQGPRRAPVAQPRGPVAAPPKGPVTAQGPRRGGPPPGRAPAPAYRPQAPRTAAAARPPAPQTAAVARPAAPARATVSRATAAAPRLPNTGTGGLLDANAGTGITSWLPALLLLSTVLLGGSGVLAYRRQR